MLADALLTPVDQQRRLRRQRVGDFVVGDEFPAGHVDAVHSRQVAAYVCFSGLAEQGGRPHQVLYLSSDLAGAVTGSVYLVDGGRTAH